LLLDDSNTFMEFRRLNGSPLARRSAADAYQIKLV
jgi:hypothetical protein